MTWLYCPLELVCRWFFKFDFCFFSKDNHEEAQEELPKKSKFFFSAAVQTWDAEFYVKVDDNIDLDLGKHFQISLGSKFYSKEIWSF